MNRSIRSSVAVAVATLALSFGATAQQPIVLQWQTANLTESQYEPVWKQTIAEFEAANPGIKVEPALVARKDHWTKFVAASQAKKEGKFEIVSAEANEAVLKRGGTIAWISFSHRALPCKAVIKGKKPASEMFFEIEIPKTTIVTENDWMKFCQEANDALAAGRK